MKGFDRYPIYIEHSEQEIVKDMVRDYNCEISEVWQQLLDSKNPIFANAYEQGFLASIIVDQRYKVPGIWKQLIDMMKKFREDAGVKITEINENLIQLRDKDGMTMTREKYEWEKV